jgi:hypothetical protein
MIAIIETETAIYLLDREVAVLKRFPRDAPLDVENSPHALPAAVAALRKDGEAIPFKLLSPMAVGKPVIFQLQIRDDGVPTIRTTTDVVRITVAEDVVG